MMYSAMLLASLLASAHGFAATPTVGSRETFATEMECKDYAFTYCNYGPPCFSNDDCQGRLQCEKYVTTPVCKLPEWPFCPQVHDGAGGIRYEVECS